MAMAAREITATRHRRIRCSCGAFLFAGHVPLGGQHRLELQRCTDCRHYPIAFIDSDGEYCVVTWPRSIDPMCLPWPNGGWK